MRAARLAALTLAALCAVPSASSLPTVEIDPADNMGLGSCTLVNAGNDLSTPPKERVWTTSATVPSTNIEVGSIYVRDGPANPLTGEYEGPITRVADCEGMPIGTMAEIDASISYEYLVLFRSAVYTAREVAVNRWSVTTGQPTTTTAGSSVGPAYDGVHIYPMGVGPECDSRIVPVLKSENPAYYVVDGTAFSEGNIIASTPEDREGERYWYGTNHVSWCR